MNKGVITLGEALIDFIPLDNENINFQKSPGGAPANVAVGLARLGARSSFLGKVGDDVLGKFLKKTLNDYGVSTEYMYLTQDTRTGVVFVTLDQSGERSFDFYINPSADRFLEESEVDEAIFENHNVLHFGSISMIDEPSKTATKTAVKKAREKGLMVSYDPNLRLGLWSSEEKARETILSMMGEADLVKISEEELEFLTGESDIEMGVEKLQKYDIPVLYVTLGALGSHVYIAEGHTQVPAMKVESVDTTGAGDAFVSGLLYQLSEHGTVEQLSLKELEDITRFASVSGALAASTKGAMTALPTKKEVEDYLN
ncbi:aminoimidazole riboside kinase [Halobacillus halophilus]|uniref:Fructokinase n=1 Tax=Halobacillus halophilus (strain ATCC 35676 / DSM 2266 / JCM 20832 / KCTC 3685 / LMG 17431 / NBRC 102448 / NCIMB 2269) TaxID=866895 RepID=I0JSJ9_HALH3|nr:aminoimidazole riboside kinase [Halobacillus halophilus]ASF41055.1 aminoimidazole riboside kinase [Halobacillus halophilus]CCG47121.1 fructokinase [Halobacillus halophilus DSM 2266]